MRRPADTELYLGYSERELAESPYARFFRPELAPLSAHVREALATGPVAWSLMPGVDRAADLQKPGYEPVETGYTTCPDGSARISVLTPMPGVTPAMWDWWFAWHGSEAQRYKLWHPRAHVHVGWSDGRDDLAHYIGRTSNVVEFVGATRMRLVIRFVPPASVGFDEARLAAAGETAICARGSLAGAPIATGWLIHHVRPTADGAEMRSRFWLGGGNVRPRGMEGGLGRALGGVAARLAPMKAVDMADLLVHCAQEMAHLAAILPDLHTAFGPSNSERR